MKYGSESEASKTVYSWGTKTGTHSSHFFKHEISDKRVQGQFWESLCGKHKTAQLGFDSDYRRMIVQDTKCTECLKMAVKLKIAGIKR